MTDRYDVSDLREGQFEPGSRDLVLRNKLGIKSVDEMNIAETAALASAMEEFVHLFDAQHRFSADDIRHMHRRWLGSIYDWAGEYRQERRISVRIRSLDSETDGRLRERTASTPHSVQDGRGADGLPPRLPKLMSNLY